MTIRTKDEQSIKKIIREFLVAQMPEIRALGYHLNCEVGAAVRLYNQLDGVSLEDINRTPGFLGAVPSVEVEHERYMRALGGVRERGLGHSGL